MIISFGKLLNRFSLIICHKGTVNLVENDTNVSDEHVVTDNNYFNIIVKNFLTLTKRVFKFEISHLGEMIFFQLGVWPISFNCLDDIPRNEFHCGYYSIAVILTDEISLQSVKCYVNTTPKSNHTKTNTCVNVKETHYSNCCCGIRTTTRSVLRQKKTEYYLSVFLTEGSNIKLNIFR